tara:strand:+ start:2701 stop:3048 length:348 start_codon:yes stop_codon:yes gene_type:complete
MIMSWEKILKEEGELPWDAKKDMYHEAIDTPNCEVRKCEAISCVNNYYEDFKEFGDEMKKCMLSDVDVDSNGKCQQFERAPNARSPGQQSLIDRTRRMSNQTPAPLGGESTYEEV